MMNCADNGCNRNWQLVLTICYMFYYSSMQSFLAINMHSVHGCGILHGGYHEFSLFSIVLNDTEVTTDSIIYRVSALLSTRNNYQPAGRKPFLDGLVFTALKSIKVYRKMRRCLHHLQPACIFLFVYISPQCRLLVKSLSEPHDCVRVYVSLL